VFVVSPRPQVKTVRKRASPHRDVHYRITSVTQVLQIRVISWLSSTFSKILAKRFVMMYWHRKRTSLFRNWFFWLIRLMMIQGTVAPCQVQEWVQCTRHLTFVP
jgi:hypothetical protein